jgi:hypothetical protein
MTLDLTDRKWVRFDGRWNYQNLHKRLIINHLRLFHFGFVLQKSRFWLSRPFPAGGRKKNAIYPHITQMNADEEFPDRRERRKPGKKLCSLCLLLFKGVFRICVNLRDLRATPNPVAALRAALQSVRIAHFREDFTTDFRIKRISFEQKGTKGTKGNPVFVAFVCFC